jgi:NADH-quinone oxidoreductase subunit I
MQLTNRSKQVSNKEMTLGERMYLPAIAGGLRITLSHLLKKKATINYPDQVREHSAVFRGQHVLKRDAQGRENCTACGLCAVSCPAEAITMVAGERQKGEEHLYREEKYAVEYNINMLRCIFCGLCEEACPKDAIYLTDRIVTANYEREDFIFRKEDLVETVALEGRVDISKRKKD